MKTNRAVLGFVRGEKIIKKILGVNVVEWEVDDQVDVAGGVILGGGK